MKSWDILRDGGSAQSPIMLLIKKIHSLDYFGWFANRLIELAAGWCDRAGGHGYLSLVAAQQAKSACSKIRNGRHEAPFWRDLHAVTGIYTGHLHPLPGPDRHALVGVLGRQGATPTPTRTGSAIQHSSGMTCRNHRCR